MYLITAYLDDKSTKELQNIIDEIAGATGNDFMTANNVMPHLTVSAFDERSEDAAMGLFGKMEEKLYRFCPITARITSFGLSKPNPLRNLRSISFDEIKDRNLC